MRTQEEVMQNIVTRRHVWESAEELVEKLVDKHGLESHRAGGGNIFVAGSTITPVDQNISSIIEVADWLLNPID